MKPLEDVRIISLEQYGAGPWGSLHLAELGADVIKIEDPTTGGDVGRYVPPYNAGEDSLFYEAFNRNKRSIALDITSVEGRDVFEDLVRGADAVYSNLRGDVPEKLGITYDALKSVNPQIVCCSLTGYGMTGDAARRPGYDYMLQASAGWMDMTGEPGGPPTKSGFSLVDFSGGYVAALSLISGVHAARRDGVGMDCDVSLFDTAISMLNYVGSWHLNEGFEPQRTRHSAHPSLVPFGAFETADGWITVGCAKEKFWTRLVGVLGDQRFEAPEYADFAQRLKNREQLLPQLEETFSTRSADFWVESLEAAGVPVAKVRSVEEALDDPEVARRGMLVETPHHRWGTLTNIASPVRVGEARREHTPAPRIDEHRDEILSELPHKQHV